MPGSKRDKLHPLFPESDSEGLDNPSVQWFRDDHSSGLPDDHWATEAVEAPLHEQFESIIVPMSAQEWARRYRDVLNELEELRRRSPFPQLCFRAIERRDSLTTHHFDNSLLQDYGSPKKDCNL